MLTLTIAKRSKQEDLKQIGVTANNNTERIGCVWGASIGAPNDEFDVRHGVYAIRDNEGIIAAIFWNVTCVINEDIELAYDPNKLIVLEGR